MYAFEEMPGDYRRNLNQGCKSGGFTLLEVVLALVIWGIMLSLGLRLITEQWRGAREIKERLEAQYAVMTAGKTVADAVRSAQSIQWVSPGVLKVLPWPDSGTLTTDLYYIADKDYDGVKDLYCEHLNVANPVASRITTWACREVEPGLWEIFLQATVGKEQVGWRGIVRQRTYKK